MREQETAAIMARSAEQVTFIMHPLEQLWNSQVEKDAQLRLAIDSLREATYWLRGSGWRLTNESQVAPDVVCDGT